MKDYGIARYYANLKFSRNTSPMSTCSESNNATDASIMHATSHTHTLQSICALGTCIYMLTTCGLVAGYSVQPKDKLQTSTSMTLQINIRIVRFCLFVLSAGSPENRYGVTRHERNVRPLLPCRKCRALALKLENITWTI